jgi:hypothetical protein
MWISLATTILFENTGPLVLCAGLNFYPSDLPLTIEQGSKQSREIDKTRNIVNKRYIG